jgi:radical SAM superfamily enzyme YgiQ (UPF0313 family)
MNPVKIKNLIYRKKGKIIENACREPIDLEKLPFPKYEKFEMEKYRSNAIPIVSSRGCPYQCIYCPIKITMGRKFRFRSPESIIKEIKYWYKKGYRQFRIQDDNFTLLKERVHRFCDMIEKSGMDNLLFSCDNGVRADKVDEELLKKMKKVGFKYISFGVEAGTDRVLKAIKKGENIGVIDKAIKTACNLGFEVTLFFLVGSPTETSDDVTESIKIALKYDIKDVRFYNIIPFPRTELYDWIQENNYFLESPEVYLNNISHWDNKPIFKTPELDEKQRKELLKRTKQIRSTIRRRWFRKRLWNMGVTGKIMSPILQFEFIRDPLMNSKFIQRGPLKSFVRRFTERTFT